MADPDFTSVLAGSPVRVFLEDYRNGVPNSIEDPTVTTMQSLHRQGALSLEASKDIDQMPYVLKDIIEYEEKKAGTGIGVNFTEEFPDSQIFVDVFNPNKPVNDVGTQYGDLIQYKLLQRRPGHFAQTSTPMAPGVRREYSMHLRWYGDDPDFPGYQLYSYGQRFDNVFQLVCWARTAKQANIRVMWLEDLMQRYFFALKLKGFNQIRYEGRDKDVVFTPEAQSFKLAGRYLTFYCRTEKIILVREKTLEEVLISLGIDSDNVSTN